MKDRLLIEKTQSQHTRTSKTGKTFIAGQGSKVLKPCSLCNENPKEISIYGKHVCDNCKQTDEYTNKQKLAKQRAKETVIDKYGVNNAFLVKDEEGTPKREVTHLERYGVKNPMQYHDILH